MVVASLHCEQTEQVDTQADGADQGQLVRVHLRGSSLYEWLASLEMRMRKITNNR